jgi:hypothetical protein
MRSMTNEMVELHRGYRIIATPKGNVWDWRVEHADETPVYQEVSNSPGPYEAIDLARKYVDVKFG